MGKKGTLSRRAELTLASELTYVNELPSNLTGELPHSRYAFF